MCRAQRKLCKSSVSSTRTACGQWRATRQPNCSSDTKRSKITTSGCSSATNVSKLLQLSLTSTAFAQGERRSEERRVGKEGGEGGERGHHEGRNVLTKTYE